MKKWSIEAEELLSKIELLEIKGGSDPDEEDHEGGDCLICSTCVACQTCKVCTTRMMDVIIV